MALPKRVLFPAASTDSRSGEKALAYAISCARGMSGNIPVLLLFPSLGQIETLGGLPPEGQAALVKGKEVQVSGTNVTLVAGSEGTVQNLKSTRRRDCRIVVGFYVTQKILDYMDSLRKAECLIVVPWVDEDALRWKNAWLPEIHGQPSNATAPMKPPDAGGAISRLTSNGERVIPFEKEYKGKTYECERRVTGVRKFRQTITVIGVGSKNDSADYGPKNHPLASMAGVAKLIAFEILQARIR